jgi:hypothetical protein
VAKGMKLRQVRPSAGVTEALKSAGRMPQPSSDVRSRRRILNSPSVPEALKDRTTPGCCRTRTLTKGHVVAERQNSIGRTGFVDPTGSML